MTPLGRKMHGDEGQAAVTLSFDDGWKCIYENAFPLLQNAGIKSTHYIVSGYLDDAQFPAYMNATEVASLHTAGHEIGCHTACHKHLPHESDSIIDSEVSLSFKYLRGLNMPVETFAYPFGEYDNRVLAVVKSAGFSGARSVIRGFNDPTSDRFLLKCQAVKVSTSVPDVTAWIDEAIKNGTWLILMFHQIDYEGREWSARPETLAAILDYIRGRDVRTLTVKQGLKEMFGPSA